MAKDTASPKQAFDILSFYSQQSIHASIVQHSQRKPTVTKVCSDIVVIRSYLMKV